jgi:hypothetical protein
MGFPNSEDAKRQASPGAVDPRRFVGQPRGSWLTVLHNPRSHPIPLCFAFLDLRAGYPRLNPRNGVIARGERLVQLGCVEIVHRLSEGRTGRNTQLHQRVAIQ